MTTERTRLSNWDPILIIAQIVSLQALHYLTVAILLPPLLYFSDEPTSLTYAGGPANVGMIMDWREMASRSVANVQLYEGAGDAWSGGHKVGVSVDHVSTPAALRGWIIAGCWLVACYIDSFYIKYLIRRPILVYDFVLTFWFNHLLLTTYYSASIPTSLFFWITTFGGTVGTIVFGEQATQKLQMAIGFNVDYFPPQSADAEAMEMGNARSAG
ncbi:hypothetical protein FISHEDRAFT_64033 [Fistulina hepatica ATCC 64428]|uniref:Uncharacterized protein n=1 Tax=Fistulina hepatica ATCC 64428 TaxID=1128425 RepID=A0A0D7AKR4_9AGAR|nr:hypothetical protein FISHEDRAFT_64033 [Fistulina hepatica ATCC 64428]